MRNAIYRLKALLVTALAVALVLGPCISLTGYTGTTAAHAHSDGMGSDASGHAHMGHGMPDGSPHDPAQHGQPLSCEELCEGWAIAKSKRDTAVEFSSGAGSADAWSVSHLAAVIPGSWLREPPPPRVSNHDPRQRETHLLTRRLRL